MPAVPLGKRVVLIRAEECGMDSPEVVRGQRSLILIKGEESGGGAREQEKMQVPWARCPSQVATCPGV